MCKPYPVITAVLYPLLSVLLRFYCQMENLTQNLLSTCQNCIFLAKPLFLKHYRTNRRVFFKNELLYITKLNNSASPLLLLGGVPKGRGGHANLYYSPHNVTFATWIYQHQNI